MHATWSVALRTLLGAASTAPAFVERRARPASTPIDITDRRYTLAGLLPAASESLALVIGGAGDRLQGGALSDADGIVLVTESARGVAPPYLPGTALFEGDEPAAALRRGLVTLIASETPRGCDLLLPIAGESGVALRAVLAFRCGPEPPPAAVLALALQAARAMSWAADVDAVRARYESVIATIGHELRQPLSALVTALDLLGRTSSGLAPHPFEVAQRQTRQIMRLVEAVLDASRLSRRRLDLVPRRLDVRDVLHAAVESVRDDIAARQQRLEIDLPPRPIRCVADAPRLQQVFVNLLTNANRYTPPHGAIAVRARAAASDIVVEVSDTGIGLDPAARERIFHAFTQGRAGARQGLGLGLTISRGIVEGHGGSIGVESAGAGRGSTFIVRLPGAIRPVRAGLRLHAGRQHPPARGGASGA